MHCKAWHKCGPFCPVAEGIQITYFLLCMVLLNLWISKQLVLAGLVIYVSALLHRLQQFEYEVRLRYLFCFFVSNCKIWIVYFPFLPQECFHEKDYLNYRYHAKRSLYLCLIKKYLASSSSIHKVEWSTLQNEARKPVLLVHSGLFLMDLFVSHVFSCIDRIKWLLGV